MFDLTDIWMGTIDLSPVHGRSKNEHVEIAADGNRTSERSVVSPLGEAHRSEHIVTTREASRDE